MCYTLQESPSPVRFARHTLDLTTSALCIHSFTNGIMRKHQWIGSTESFSKALSDVQTSYQDKIHADIDHALEDHDQVMARLKNAEKTTSSVNTKVMRNLGRSDLKGLAAEVSRLESGIQSVEACINECLDVILDIDEELPPKERLVNPGNTNEDQYSNLYEALRFRGA